MLKVAEIWTFGLAAGPAKLISEGRKLRSSIRFGYPQLDQKITLRDYQGSLRQLIVAGLGHEEPTFLITNQLQRSPATLSERYAGRMLIENQIADGIDFFHMDAFSSAVPMKVSCDLLLTLMASRSAMVMLRPTHAICSAISSTPWPGAA